MEQLELLRYVVGTFEECGIPYAVVGSYASMAYGEFRMTQDIDVLAEVTLADIVKLLERFPPPDWYVSDAAMREAISRRGQFNILHIPTANKVDVMLPKRSAWGQQQLSTRRSLPLFPDRTVSVAAPEEVILGKLLYYSEGGSDKHLRDIAAMLQMNVVAIDVQKVEEWATTLGVQNIWQTVLARASKPPSS